MQKSLLCICCPCRASGRQDCGPSLLPAPFPLPDSFHGAAAPPRTEALVWRSCAVQEHLIAARAVAGTPNKMFMTDYPRKAGGCLLGFFHFDLDSLSMAPALGIPASFSRDGGPICLLLLPTGPSQSLLPARVTAIPLPPSPGAEVPAAPLEQTKPGSRPTTR